MSDAGSDSESDAGERIKNVQFLLIKSKVSQLETDENYAYKRKLGDLIFNANFEAGNLGYVEQVDDYSYDLMVRPDVANPRYRLWFNFTVSNQRPHQCVVFTFANLSDQLKLLHEGMTPIVRSRLVPNWTRLHEDQVFYYRSPPHGDRYVLSIVFRFDTYDNEHQFALFYPYTYTALVNFLNRWLVEFKRSSKNSFRELDKEISFQTQSPKSSTLFRCQSPELYALKMRGQVDTKQKEEFRAKSSLGFSPKVTKNSKPPSISQINITSNSTSGQRMIDFQVVPLTTSILSKSIYKVIIRDANLLDSQKPKVIVLCRSCGNLDGAVSFVCQGIIDYMLTNGSIAQATRQYIDLIIFPMIDPDGICAGNSRSDILGQRNIFASIKAIKSSADLYSNFLKVIDEVQNYCEGNLRVLLLELRVNLNIIGSRVTGTHYDDSMRMERHLCWPRLLARFANDFYLENCEFMRLGGLFNHSLFGPKFSNKRNVDHYQLEVSPFACYKRTLTERVYEEYDQLKYISLGKAMVFSFLELLRPKDKNLPECVNTILDSFHPKSRDIDALMLAKD